jgi:hypothetical protein
MRRQHREADVLPDMATLVEDGRAEAIEAEAAAARPANGFRSEPCSPSMTFCRRGAQWVWACSPISMPM